METQALFESVPNFSEGRRHDVMEAIAAAAGTAYLLDTDPDPDHNRAVVSIAGRRDRLVEGLMGAIGEAVRRIDLREHRGVHPRVGAADVVPIIPIGGATLDEWRGNAPRAGRGGWGAADGPPASYCA